MSDFSMGCMLWLTIAIVFLTYFAPTIVARERRHVHTLPIFMINLLVPPICFLPAQVAPTEQMSGLAVGLALLTWVGCLAWAVWPKLNGR
jgi:hypothetical protein